MVKGQNMKLSSRDPRNKPAERKSILLAKVEIDHSTQARVRKSPERVQDLFEVLERGGDFCDPVEVYYDGFRYWVGDGFHRLDAYERAGRLKVTALVREGGQRDAIIHAAGANDEHGLPRNRKDLRKAICLLLDDDEIGKLSDRTIAQLAHCSDKTVAAIRRELGKDTGKRVYTDKHGNQTEMDVSGQGRRVGGFREKVNAFHELPVGVREVLKKALDVISQEKPEIFAFARTWLAAQLPHNSKEARNLLHTLEAEEQSGAEDDADQDGPRF
jgi:hypothetical protein